MSLESLKGIEDAELSDRLPWDQPGVYIERIDKVHHKEWTSKKDGQSKEFIAFDKTVLAVLDDDDSKSHFAGQQVSHKIWRNLSWPKMFMSSVKGAIVQIMRCDPKDVTWESVKEMISDKQPLTDVLVECEVRPGETNEGKPFNFVTYNRRVPAAEVKERLSEDKQNRFFPNGKLDKMIELEAAAA